MDAHTHQTEPAPVVAAAQLILHALSTISERLDPFNDKSRPTRVRYNIDSKAGQLLISAIAFMIANAAALDVEPEARDAFVDETIKDIIETRLVQPSWGSLCVDEIAPRLKALVHDLMGRLVWVGAKG